jgi:DNA replication protein DnaC
MAFDVKYHISAKEQIEQRRSANLRKLELRQREISGKFPQYDALRAVMAETGAKIVKAVLGGNAESELAQIRQENTNAAVKIKELLLSNKYPANYLEAIYSCESCKDSGVTSNGYCDCYKTLVKRIAAQEINSKSPLSLTGFGSFDIELYPDTNENGYNIRNIMRGNLQICVDFAEDFHLPGAGLLLSGKTGLGKTHLSLAIAGRVIERGFNVIYGSAPTLFRKVENEHFNREKGNTMDSLQSCELLVLDDIGAEWESSTFYASVFFNLLDSRMNAGTPTVINTNLTMGELEARYGERIMSRFLTKTILKFYGNDIRQIKRRKSV